MQTRSKDNQDSRDSPGVGAVRLFFSENPTDSPEHRDLICEIGSETTEYEAPEQEQDLMDGKRKENEIEDGDEQGGILVHPEEWPEQRCCCCRRYPREAEDGEKQEGLQPGFSAFPLELAQ